MLAHAARDLLVAFGVTAVVGAVLSPWLVPGRAESTLGWAAVLFAWVVIAAAFRTMVLVILIRHHPASRDRPPDAGPWTVLNAVLCIVIALAALAFLPKPLGGIGVALGLIVVLISYFAPLFVIDDRRNAPDAFAGSFYLAGRRIPLLALILAAGLLAAFTLAILVELAISPLLGAHAAALRMARAIPLMLAPAMMDALIVVVYFQLVRTDSWG